MTTTRDTHSNPVGCVEGNQPNICPTCIHAAVCEHNDGGVKACLTYLPADVINALLVAYDAAEKALAGSDFHVGDLLPSRPVKDDPAMSREMLAESQRGVERYMVDVAAIAAERDALKARVEELEAQVRGVLSNVRLVDIYNTTGMGELAYRVGHWTRPPQTAQLDSAVKGGDSAKEVGK